MLVLYILIYRWIKDWTGSEGDMKVTNKNMLKSVTFVTF